MADYRVAPIEQINRPVGTIAEVQAEGLDISTYPTCAKRNPAQEIVGCPWHDKCRVSARAVDGPKNYGIEVLYGRAIGGEMVRMKNDCFWIADHADDIEKNGGSIKVIANEGEEFDMVTSIAVNSGTGEPTFQKDPLAKREMRRVKVKVPKYPRPGENPAMLSDLLRAESAENERKRRTDESIARNYGLEGTIAPLDKRDAGRDAGRKATGGGKP